MTSKKRQRHVWAEREGRGGGQAGDYVPYAKLGRQQEPSKGRSTYARSSFSDRHHTVLTGLEKNCLVQLCLLNPLDVREHFPLAMHKDECDEFSEFPGQFENTIAISTRLGLRHPGDKNGKFRITSSFVVTTRAGGTEVYCLKDRRNSQIKQHSDARLIEIEYWLVRGVTSFLVTDKDIDTIVIANGLMFRGFRHGPHTERTVQWLQRVVKLARQISMSEVANQLAAEGNENRENVIDAIKSAAANGRLNFCLHKNQLQWTRVWVGGEVQTKTTAWPALRVLT